MARSSARTRVYSYIRFSTPEQLKGNSLNRQLDKSQKWCQRKGYVLDESFKLHDLGVSAFRGKNAAEGKLAAFLNAVEQGMVEKGSILLLESLDRLSRDSIAKALKLFLGILEKGVVIVTLEPEETFSEDSINDLVKIIVALVILSRAYEESMTKSKRISHAREEARDKARNEGVTLTRQFPYWIREDKRGNRVAIPGAAKVIRQIFDLKLQGVGTLAIARKLNEQASWAPELNSEKYEKRKWRGWRGSYIKKILGNRAVLGEYQPYHTKDGKREAAGDAIPDYFERIIDDKTFYAVQKRFEANKDKGGRTGKVTNLFTHLVRCAYCGGPMHLSDKGRPPKGGVYLVCGDGKRKFGPCGQEYNRSSVRHSMRYEEVEETLLANCWRLRPEQVLPQPDKQRDVARNLRLRITGADGELERLETQLENGAIRAVEAPTKEIADRVYAHLRKLEDRKAVLSQQIEFDKAKLESVEGGLAQVKEWTANIRTLKNSLGDVAVRLRLQLHLRELIEKIEVYSVGYKTQSDPDAEAAQPDSDNELTPMERRLRRTRTGDTIWQELEDTAYECNPKFRPDKEFRQFQRYVIARRMSKDGRFLRVHFKSGVAIDVVPPGSIASGQRLEIITEAKVRSRDWRFVSPVVETLYEEFKAQQTGKRLRRGKSVPT